MLRIKKFYFSVFDILIFTFLSLRLVKILFSHFFCLNFKKIIWDKLKKESKVRLALKLIYAFGEILKINNQIIQTTRKGI